MPRARAGKVQIASEVETGLRAAAEARAIEEGLSLSIVVRRALMFHLGVDAHGAPISRNIGPAPEYEALSAALGQHHVRVDGALDRMGPEEIRELQWAASELAEACARRRGSTAMEGRPR
jgi:hypothetical protein